MMLQQRYTRSILSEISSKSQRRVGVETFNIDRFRLSEVPTPIPQSPPAKRQYLKGPIPWPWLLRVFELQTNSTTVLALVIWRVCGLRRSLSFKLPPSATRVVGGRSTVYRALSKL